MFSRFIFVALVMISAGYANAEEILAQTHFLVRDGNKEFSVQHYASRDLYIVLFGLLWANFNQQIHSMAISFQMLK